MTIYRLPFDDDGKWQFLGLGNWDDPASGGHQHYAFDFRHPVGGVVRAARDGVVAFVENHDGNIPAGDNVPGYGTAILIRHIDGTVADYEHLKFNSPKVVKGQYVLQGEIIALSGKHGQLPRSPPALRPLHVLEQRPRPGARCADSVRGQEPCGLATFHR